MSLIDLLPDYYKNSAEVINIQESFEHWTTYLNLARDDLLLQLNVNTATWGLALWEKYLGLSTDVSKSNEFRRERIRAKIRGIGTVTKQMIVDVASSYSNGEVEVIEDNASYSFKIKFIGTKGIPGNMADLSVTINEIKPAHLAFTFEYTYNTWSAVMGNLWGDVTEMTWYELSTI